MKVMTKVIFKYIVTKTTSRILVKKADEESDLTEESKDCYI